MGETSSSANRSTKADGEAANFFRRETLGWTLAYEGKTAQLKHRKGVRYIAALLRDPERKMHVCDLACVSPDHTPGPSRGSEAPRDREVEKTRKAVRNAIRNAVTCIEVVHPELGRHLHNCIITGCFCYYRPERTIVWQIEG